LSRFGKQPPFSEGSKIPVSAILDARLLSQSGTKRRLTSHESVAVRQSEVEIEIECKVATHSLALRSYIERGFRPSPWSRSHAYNPLAAARRATRRAIKYTSRVARCIREYSTIFRLCIKLPSNKWHLCLELSSNGRVAAPLPNERRSVDGVFSLMVSRHGLSNQILT
jgi:hypothetical protein